MVTAAVEPRELLGLWGIDEHAELTPAQRGSNNKTLVVTDRDRRLVLRCGANFSAVHVRTEHRLLAFLRGSALPFAVPAPVPTLSGDTVGESLAGPVTLCRWIPGVRPDLTTEPAFERFGCAIRQLVSALTQAPLDLAPHDWRGGPLEAFPDVCDVDELCRELTDQGADGGHVASFSAAAQDVAQWWPTAAGDLPVQLVHGDVGASNMLIDSQAGRVTGVLDFEFAGIDFRVQDLAVGMLLSGALEVPDWQTCTAALARGYMTAECLTDAEIQAIPELIVGRCVGTVLWRASRWRRGQVRLDDVLARLRELREVTQWLEASRTQLLTLLTKTAGAKG